ncbi:phosphate acetyltransferase [Xylariaceae sp. FL0662B]|nr:phosphate acetyltransferase [Xylariaceae sp. FL0662B]
MFRLLHVLQRDGLSKMGFVKLIVQFGPGANLSGHFAHTLYHTEVPLDSNPFAVAETAHTNGCDVVLVQGFSFSAGGDDGLQLSSELNAQMARTLGAHVVPVISGSYYQPLSEVIDIITRPNTDEDDTAIGRDQIKLLDPHDVVRLKGSQHVPLLVSVPFESRLNAPRLVDMISSLGLQVLWEGSEIANTRVFCNSRPGTLIATPGNRSDIVLAMTSAFMLGVPPLSAEISSLIMQPQTQGLAVLATDDDTFATNARLATPDYHFQVVDYVAKHIKTAALMQKIRESDKLRLTSPTFRNPLVRMAPRTLHAVDICHSAIQQAAAAQGLTLPPDVEIIDPGQVRVKYVGPMAVVGTVMLALGEADSLVSGAIHMTTAPQVKLVSSVFFMLMPNRMIVFDDCAISPSPSAEDVADIALRAADSAAMFNVELRVAMISYASGASAKGTEVIKRRPGLLIDGSMQYDTVMDPSVGQQKLPDSVVAGRANVFVYPDLNTGNTAVQRSAKVASIGPVLTGLRRAVDDLSRGSSVDDIVYKIALTTIQAAQASGESGLLAKRGRPSLDRDALDCTISNGTGAAS